jgi:hypothetical protein
VSGTLTPGTATNIYQFNANAGDLYYFEILAGGGYPNNWRLIDPYGQQVWSSYFGTPYRFSGPQALPSTGTYTLLVEGYSGNTSPVSYSFSANSVPLAPPIQVTGLGLQPAPDLITTGLAVTANGPIQSGSLLTVTWFDNNTGTFVTSSSWTDQVLVRDANGNIIASVTLPYDPTVSGPLAPGASSPRQVSLRLPNGNAGAGRVTFFVTVDALNNVIEQNASGQAELNNTSSLSVTSQLASYPDLEVTGLTVDPIDDWTPGSTVTVHWNTLNAGDSPTQGSWSEQISVRDLSTGATLVLATIPYDASATGYGALAPGASQSRQYSFNWPSGLSSTGNYEFSVTTDSQNNILEANASGTAETNNTLVRDIASAPDLQVNNLAVTSSPVQSGATVTLSWNDVNTGVAAASAGWYDHIVAVNTTTGEQLVNSAVFYDPTQQGNAALAAGQNLPRSFTFALPDGKRGTGSLQISVIVNRDQNNVPSIIEAADGIDATANNQASITVQSQAKAYPDLAATNFVIPASGNGGDQVQISWTVTNLGSVATMSSQWTDSIILSTDPVFGNADDVTVAQFTHTGGLGANQAYTASQTLTLPLQEDGPFYITVRTDSGGAVIEPDTLANNYAPAQQITLSAPSADLSVPAVVAPATANSGDRINVSWRVTNSGDGTTSVSTWKDRIILSTGSVYNPVTDIVLGDVTHTGALAANANYVGQASVQLPNGVSGQFNILVVTDIGGQVYEKGATQNNTGVSVTPIAIAAAPSADLTVANVVAASAGVPGQQQTVSWTVQNIGNGPARAPWVDSVYLSSDGTLNTAVQLASVTNNFDVAAGGGYSAQATITLPDWVDGTYQLLVYTDATAKVYEPNHDTNNIASSPLTLTHPDLAASISSVTPNSPNSGDQTTVSWTVTNTGTGSALGSWTDSLYLSRGTTVGPNDIKLGDYLHTGDLASGAHYTGRRL